MLGWCADFFRLWWGLLYWNTRKTWFRVRRGRARCPCQSPSDSGRAYETQCEASLLWHRPRHFRHVCPLLVETKDGLRCSANTADVRPFWGRALKYYGAAALAVYAAAVIGIFIFLRTVGYPVSIVHVGLPPLWHRVGQARGWYFLDQSNRAFAEGKTTEGLLYLDNSYEFDPTNYAVGLALAKHFQVGRAARSDAIFKQLLDEHPAQRSTTAQAWFRALLARGNFPRIATLAKDELLTENRHAAVWLRALLFAARQTKDEDILRELIANDAPAAKRWRRVFETERLLLQGKKEDARSAVEGPWPSDDSAGFTLFYRVSVLTELNRTFEALDLLARFPGVLDAEATVTLRMEALADHGATTLLHQEVERLLAPRLTLENLSIVKIICAQLIRYPDAAVFARLWAKLEREQVPFNTESAGIWFSVLCAAGAVGDLPRLHELTARLKQASGTPFVVLSLFESFFRGETADQRITRFLPILPLPLEVTYAVLERYGQAPGATVRPPRRT